VTNVNCTSVLLERPSAETTGGMNQIAIENFSEDSYTNLPSELTELSHMCARLHTEHKQVKAELEHIKQHLITAMQAQRDKTVARLELRETRTKTVQLQHLANVLQIEGFCPNIELPLNQDKQEILADVLDQLHPKISTSTSLSLRMKKTVVQGKDGLEVDAETESEDEE
jgi:hypothetical protein